MTRNEFLSKKWSSYPLLPGGVSFFGRLQEIKFCHGSWSVTLLREGESQQRLFPKLFFCELQDLEVKNVLLSGDLVAISEEGGVTLLAPQLQKLPALTLRLQTLRLWQDYIGGIRDFFREQGFVEMATPSLVKCPGTEPSLDVFSTEFIHGSRKEKLYLPTSPELHLKKALSLGAEKIFEIKNVFRNGEVTEHHQPEFTMIEWYRAYENLQSIKTDVRNLINYLLEKIPALKAQMKGPLVYDTFTIQQLFSLRCDFNLKPQTGAAELKALAEKLKVDVRAATSIDDYFFLIFLEKIESQLIPEHLSFVEKYPPYQAALARINEEGWGDRFEVYWQGLELANAFHELNDPAIQKQRFIEDLAKKRALKKEEVPLDPEFMQCLEAGLPPSAGIALGVERLFMALTGIKNISEIRIFPLK
ncbi:MAG: EF-P lysine aminoacylase EpmA [Pseudobdellovibrionaceae bacterium]